MTSSAPQHSTRPMVRVVVVNFDGGDVTRRCIDSLLATNYPADRLEIVVVDNASVDGFNWVLREEYPQVRLIQSDTNEGFARGCNLAMRDLDGIDHVALINNDALVDPDWLEPLLVPMADPTVGAVVPKLLLNVWAHAVTLRTDRLHRLADDRLVGARVLRVEIDGVDRTEWVRFDERFWPDDPDDPGRWSKGFASVWWPATDEPRDVRLTVVGATDVEVQLGTPTEPVSHAVGREPATLSCVTSQRVRIVNSAGGGLFKGWFGGDRGFLEPDLGQYDEPAEVFAWCGGAVLLRTAYLRDVGLFDPTYFLYYEDFDLSWRGHSSGWTYRYEPSSVVFHEHAYSSKAGSSFFRFWVDRNRRLTLVKNAPAKVAVRACVGAVKEATFDLAQHVYHQARRLRPPSPDATREIVKPVVSLAGALPSALRERRRLARRRTVSHAEIERWTITK
jgi:GT2 family glycosyltransferase